MCFDLFLDRWQSSLFSNYCVLFCSVNVNQLSVFLFLFHMYCVLQGMYFHEVCGLSFLADDITQEFTMIIRLSLFFCKVIVFSWSLWIVLC